MHHPINDETGLIQRPAPAPYPFGPASVGEVLTPVVAAEPGRVALEDGARRWTYAELDNAVHRAATALRSLEIGEGDRIAWSLVNSAEMVIGFLACARLGAVWVGVHPGLTAAEREARLADCGPKLLIDDLDWWRDFEESAPLNSSFSVDPHRPAAIAYTSGTTGTPKGVAHSQHNLLWPGLATIEMDPPGIDDRTGSPLALSTLNIMVLGPLTAFLRGGTAVVMHRTDAPGLAADLAHHRVSRAVLVPTLLHDLVHSDVDPELLCTLCTVLVGGAGTPKTIRDQFASRFGVTPTLSYGFSEAPTGVARTGTDPDRGAAPLPPVQLSIVDDEGNEVAPGQQGEICVAPTSRGPWAGSWSGTLGYWRKPQATRGLFRGGVLHTDDVGLLDESGLLTVVGRSSEIIIRGGANIFPVEIEGALCDHPTVSAAAVIGVDDARLGERVVAFVTTHSSVENQELLSHCRTLLASYKVPELIAVLDKLPRNSAGKVSKDALRSRAAELLTED